MLQTTRQHTVLDALQALAQRCDGAQSLDGQGFNGRDTNFGKSLALQHSLSEKQELAARKMLRTYARQLASLGIDVDNLTSSQRTAVSHRDTHEQATIASGGTIEYCDSCQRSFSYDLTARFHGIVLCADCNAWFEKRGLASLSEKAYAKYHAYVAPVVAESKPRYRGLATLDGASIVFNFPYDAAIKDDLKDTFKSARFDGYKKVWTLPFTALTAGITWGKKWNFDVSALETRYTEIQQAEHAARQAADLAFQTRMRNVDLEHTGSIVLRAYQKDGVRFLVQNEKAILADDMGLGKTLQALVASKAYADHTIFVIAPKSVHGDWRESAKKVNASIEIYTWQRIPDVPETDKPYCVIADEAHYAQSLKSARTQRLIALCEHAQGVFLLTGTPIKNGRPVNLYPLLSIINHPIAKDKKAFEKRYCNAHATRFTLWDTTGAAFLEELNEKIADKLLRRTKKQCLTELPEKSRVLRYVEISADDRKAYDKTYTQLQAKYRQRLWKGEIAQQDYLVLLNHLRHAASVAKVSSAVDLCEEILEQGQSVVVFFEFQESVNRFISDTRIACYGVSHLSASLNEQKREQVKVDFQNGINKVFCCTVKSGGVGLTLTAASTVVLVDRPWTPGDAIQAEDRIYRMGQQNACTAYWLRYGHTDERIDEILAEKAERIGVVLGDDTVKIDYQALAGSIF